jgi:hypothetical protein
MKKRNNNIYKAGVLFIAAVMVLSIIPTISADTGNNNREDFATATSMSEIPNNVINLNDIGTYGTTLSMVRIPFEDSSPTFQGVIYDQLPIPDDSTGHGPFSDAGSGGPYRCYDNFYGVTEDITDVHWWGLCGYGAGTPQPGDMFEISFNDDAGGMPGAAVAVFTGAVGTEITITGTGVLFWGYELFYFEMDLPTPVSMAEGWVSFYKTTVNAQLFACIDALPGEGDGQFYHSPIGFQPYDLAFELTGGGGGPGPQDCIPDACDFEILNFNNFVPGPTNSLPQYINITITNNGEIPIYEVKILADIYEKVCNPCDDCNCCFPIDKCHYNPKIDDNNCNFTVWDCPDDDVDDLGDTWTLWTDEYHTADLSYRNTNGYLRYPGAADEYVGRTTQCPDDYLQWDPDCVPPDCNPLGDEGCSDDCNDISGAACVKFDFWHKAKGEYMVDSDGYVVPIDYGYIQYSLDNGATFSDISIGDFVAYDNGWEQWSLFFLNTCSDGEYELVCGDCGPESCEGNYVEIPVCFPDQAELVIRWRWHVNPCNQYEGWYIDDVCIEKFYGPEYQLVHQTHEITDLAACPDGTKFLEFPLLFDPEPETWYYMVICGQVFSPDDCEVNLDNNCIDAQFQITDIHDIACITPCPEEDTVDIYKKTMCCQEDQIGEFEFTFKNLGTFPEVNVPVELRVARKIIEYPLMETFETDPSGRWNTYYFSGSSTVDLWDWSQGYDGIPETRSSEDQPIGTESMICGHQDIRLELMQCMGNLLTNDEIYNFCDKDFCCEEFNLTFDAKWAMPYGQQYPCGWAGEDRFYMLIHPTEGPDSAYWWGITLRTPQNPNGAIAGSHQDDWHTFFVNNEKIENWFSYTDCDGVYHPCVPFEFGWAVFSNDDVNKANPDALDKWGNPFPWGGAMIDNIKIETHNCDGVGDVVYTGFLAEESPCDDDDVNCDPDEILEPGEEETITLYWNDTEYCNWCVIADANLPNDVNPDNDHCCVQARVISDCSCAADENLGISVDLTSSTDSLWGICESDEADDNFMTATKDFGDYRAYEDGMDDSLISCEINLTQFAETGAILEFDTYFKFFSFCLAGWTFYDDGSLNEMCPPNDPVVKLLPDTGDFGEVYVRSCLEEDCGVRCDDWGEWEILWSPTDKNTSDGTGPIGCRLWWDDYYSCDDTYGTADHDLCADKASRVFDWATVQFIIPPHLCSERTQIRFRMVSNDLHNPDCWGLPEDTVSEGWYIDDISIFGLLKEELLYEDFQGGQIPGDWSIIDYSGTGTWEVRSDTSYEPPAPSVPPWATADSDNNPAFVYDTELFTPSVDLSMGGAIDLLHTFEDFAGMGQATINTYSGGIGPGFYEETLIYMDYDGDDGVPYGGAPFFAQLDTSGYADPSDVYFGFWYTTDGGTYAWSYSIDNVDVSTVIPSGIVFFEDFDGGSYCNQSGPCTWDTGAKSGDYWTYTCEIPDSWIGWIDPDCDDKWEDVPCHPTDDCFYLLHGYPTFDMGLNNALDIRIDFPDECTTWSSAWLRAYHSAIVEPGDAAYIEVSTDDGATWTLMWMFENKYAYDPIYLWQCMEKEIDLTPYIDAGLDHILVRFRWTTEGNVCCCESDYPAWGGWAVDALEIICKTETFSDETPPVTQLVFDESSGEVSLFANDPGTGASGVAATYYILDNGATQTYTGTITLSEGCHDIKFWSEDNAGNVESQKSRDNLCVDSTPPTITITEPVEGLYVFGSQVLQSRILGSGALCIGSCTIKADASDESGISLVTFEVNGDTGYDASAPYEYKYMGMHFGSATVTATAYDMNGLTAEDTATFTIYSLGLL